MQILLNWKLFTAVLVCSSLLKRAASSLPSSKPDDHTHDREQRPRVENSFYYHNAEDHPDRMYYAAQWPSGPLSPEEESSAVSSETENKSMPRLHTHQPKSESSNLGRAQASVVELKGGGEETTSRHELDNSAQVRPRPQHPSQHYYTTRDPTEPRTSGQKSLVSNDMILLQQHGSQVEDDKARATPPTRLLVHYLNEAGRELVQQYAKTVFHEYTEERTVAIEVEEGSDAIEAFIRSPLVVRVEEDSLWVSLGYLERVVDKTELADGSYWKKQEKARQGSLRRRRRNLEEKVPYGIKMIQADEVEMGKYPVQVCMVDTGLGVDHPDIDASLANGADRVSHVESQVLHWNEDKRGHGTHVAGIMSAIRNNDLGVRGVGDVHMFVTRGLDDEGRAYESDIREAIEQCENAGAKIVNLSLGGGKMSTSMKTIIDRLFKKGFLIFAAAGNSGAWKLEYPASDEKVVSVSAVDDIGWYWANSNFGPTQELMAPGVSILSTTYVNGTGYTYGEYSGTSMATPHASAAAAVLWSHYPNCTNQQIRYAMAYTALDSGAPGCDTDFGYGIVQIKSALNFLSSHSCVGANWGRHTGTGNCTTIDEEPIAKNPSPTTTERPSDVPSTGPTKYSGESSPTPAPTVLTQDAITEVPSPSTTTTTESSKYPTMTNSSFTAAETLFPTTHPTETDSLRPSSHHESVPPSIFPTFHPPVHPTSHPTIRPISTQPSLYRPAGPAPHPPTFPTMTASPSGNPTHPSDSPAAATAQPSYAPLTRPSQLPSRSTTLTPSIVPSPGSTVSPTTSKPTATASDFSDAEDPVGFVPQPQPVPQPLPLPLPSPPQEGPQNEDDNEPQQTLPQLPETDSPPVGYGSGDGSRDREWFGVGGQAPSTTHTTTTTTTISSSSGKGKKGGRSHGSKRKSKKRPSKSKKSKKSSRRSSTVPSLSSSSDEQLTFNYDPGATAAEINSLPDIIEIPSQSLYSREWFRGWSGQLNIFTRGEPSRQRRRGWYSDGEEWD